MFVYLVKRFHSILYTSPRPSPLRQSANTLNYKNSVICIDLSQLTLHSRKNYQDDF